MAFIVKKKIHGNEYYYLNESKRIGDKVKTKTLAYLGKTKKEAERRKREILMKGEVKKVEKKVGPKKSQVESKEITIEEMASFCKRKGFVYPSSEIYGGFAGFWDFGPLGVELKNNIKKEWWKSHVQQRTDVVGIDGSIITNPKVWEASGHVDSFSDVFVTCKKCKKDGKIDKNEMEKFKSPVHGTKAFGFKGKEPKCEHCGGDYDQFSFKDFKLMFETNVGAKEKSYLRPETAQVIFTDFKIVHDSSRMKLPFGIAQIGKAFRNEIAPRDFLFRSREFEQMELQFFINPDKKDDCPFYNKIKNKKIKILDASNKEEILSIGEMVSRKIFKNKWHAYWLNHSYEWFLSLGIVKDNLRLREHEKEELAHYADSAVDIEYNFPSGWKEIFGSHDRVQFDLSQHELFSKKDLKIFDEESKKKILPQVIESSFGVERALLAFMFDSHGHDEARGNTVLTLSPKISSFKASIFPIVKKPEFEKIAKDVFENLKKEFNVLYDGSGSIGRRYARNDEIGTPYCITIDGDSIKKKDVTIRERDTTNQIRVEIKNLRNVLRDLIEGDINFIKIGKVI